MNAEERIASRKLEALEDIRQELHTLNQMIIIAFMEDDRLIDPEDVKKMRTAIAKRYIK